MSKKGEDKKITILLHTRNRPEFLKRSVEYICNNADWNILDLIILDGSSQEIFPKVKSGIRNFLKISSVRLVHDPNSFVDRLSKGALMSRTPFIILAADDDLYSFDWLEGAIQSFDCDSSIGVIYGNILNFTTLRDCAFSPIKEAYIAQYKNPALAWLEDETVEERLSSLGHDTWATAGWYSIQRIEVFKKIMIYAEKYKIEKIFFEHLLIFGQAALCRTRKIEDIHLCRQVIPTIFEPISYKDSLSERNKLERCLEMLLVRECGIEASHARELVKSTLTKEYAALKSAYRKRYIRWLARKFPIIRGAISFVRSKIQSSQANIDLRLYGRSDNKDVQKNIEMITNVLSLQPGTHLK